MRLSVVVPAYKSAGTIGPCLDGLAVALGPNDEVIVVDDGSTDDTLDIVIGYPDPRVSGLRLDLNVGRGPARNHGANKATGDVLVFVDADVVVHPDAADLLRSAFTDDGLAAVFGSYDSEPAAPGLTSQFRNLLHHHTHHHLAEQSPTASHFWTGLGAISTSAFHEVGGFDEDRWARNMEDVELGHRLNDAGHAVHVRPAVQGTHLKGYSLLSMVRSDLFDRAIPWTHLMLADHRADRFVVSLQRCAPPAAAALASIAAIGALFLPIMWLGVLAMLLIGAGLSGDVWRTFRAHRGGGFAVAAIPLLYLHHLVATVGLGLGLLTAARSTSPARELTTRGRPDRTRRARHRRTDAATALDAGQAAHPTLDGDANTQGGLSRSGNEVVTNDFD